METSLKPAIDWKQRLFFRFSHPWAPTALFGPIALLLMAISLDLQPRSWVFTGVAVVAGVFYWTLIEYVLHRFVFHWVQAKEPWKSLASGLHMAHHKDTEVKDLIIAPPVVSLIFSSFIFISLCALTWNYRLALLVLAGVFFGYILYEWAHYGSHRFQPKNAMLRYLKTYHLRHHFKHPHGTFGVTTPMWDYVFGTTYRPK